MSAASLAEVTAQFERSARNTESLVRSALRWPWKRKQLPRLHRVYARQLVILGVHQFKLGQRSAAVKSLELALEQLGLARSCEPASRPSWVPVEVLSAGYLVRASAAETMATTLYGGRDSWLDDRPETAALAVAAGLLGGNDLQEIAVEAALGLESTLREFHLWCRFALDLKESDTAVAQATLTDLASCIGALEPKEQPVSGAYLPGLGLVRASRRRGIDLAVPSEGEGWPQELLHLDGSEQGLGIPREEKQLS